MMAQVIGVREEHEFRQQLLDEAELWQKCEVTQKYLDHIREEFAASQQPIAQKGIDWHMHADLALADLYPLEKMRAQLGGINN